MSYILVVVIVELIDVGIFLVRVLYFGLVLYKRNVNLIFCKFYRVIFSMLVSNVEFREVLF